MPEGPARRADDAPGHAEATLNGAAERAAAQGREGESVILSDDPDESELAIDEEERLAGDDIENAATHESWLAGIIAKQCEEEGLIPKIDTLPILGLRTMVFVGCGRRSLVLGRPSSPLAPGAACRGSVQATMIARC